MKKLPALLLAGLMIFLLTSCTPPFAPAATEAPQAEEAREAEESAAPGPSVTLRLAAAEDDEAFCARLDYAIEKMRQELPDIAVVREAPGESGGYDLLVLWESESEALLSEGQIADLAEEPEAKALLERLVPAERALALTAERALPALPAEAAEFWCLFADRELFEAQGLTLPENAAELLACARALSAAGQPLFVPGADTAASAPAFFELFLRPYDPRGLTALCCGDSSPYDEALLSAAEDLYRLQRAGAFSATDGEEDLWSAGGAALRFAPAAEALHSGEALGDAAVLLPYPLAGGGETALGTGAQRRVLAVSADSTHPSLAVGAACRLCELLSEYDGLYGCGGVMLADVSGANSLAHAVAAHRAELSGIATLPAADEDPTASAAAEGVRELMRGTMTPDEFVEIMALTLEG